jgi:hypothetical protein
MHDEIRKILAIGYSVRHIVCSGCRAGYEMYAMDAFGDVDLRRCAKEYVPLNENVLQIDREDNNTKRFKEVVKEVDGVIIGSGIERKDLDFLKGKKILGNAPEKLKEVASKEWLSMRFAELGIPQPLTYTGRKIAEGGEKATKIHYPVVAKPIFGGGGYANFFCNNEKELKQSIKNLPDFLYQEYIKGEHASVSVISTKEDAISVCVNEQLIGLDSLCYSGRPFVYCGNISPFITKFSEKMCEISEFLVKEFGLVGSNGVDFVVTEDEPFVIEVNPRFQGTLDTVELSTGLNLVDAHVKAIGGDLQMVKKRVSQSQRQRQRYAAKTIVFAKKDSLVVENLEREGRVDIPEKGRIVKKEEPVAAGIGVGNSREEAFTAAMNKVAIVKAGIREI